MELNMSADDLDNLVWGDTEYKLKFILDNPNFQFPQIVRVVQGHMVDEDDALASGQVLTIHGKKKIENILGHDVYQKEVNIPTSCPYKFKLVSLGNPRRFQGVRELCYCEYPPTYVRLEEEFSEDLNSNDSSGEQSKEESVGRDVILQLKDEVLTNDGDIIGINCQVESYDKHNIKTITLPIHYNGVFVESLPYDVVGKQYTMSEMLKEQSLPIQIQFLTSQEKNCAYGPHLGIIQLEKKHVVNSILSTTMIENIRHALTFSADLPVTIQVATGRKMNSSQLNVTNIPTSVDLKRFDYCVNSDPYSCVTMQNFDELRTPMLPRRNRSRKQSAISYELCSPMVTRHRSATAVEKTIKTASSLSNGTKNGSDCDIKRGGSSDLGKDLKEIENFFKFKFRFKNFRRSFSSKSSTSSNRDKSSERTPFLHRRADMDLDDSTTYTTSYDGQSSIADIRSIGVTSSGSGGTCNDSCYTESLTFDSRSVGSQQQTRRHRRKGSGDSGICVTGRKLPIERSRSRSRSRMSPETQSNNDSMSEWSLPINMKDSSDSKTYSSSRSGCSAYLWSADTDSSHSNGNVQNNNSTKEDYQNDYYTQQNNYNIRNYQNDAETMKHAVEQLSKTSKAKIVQSPLTTKHLESMNKIRLLNEVGVGKILDELKLHEFRSAFIENQINGELLLDLEQDDLVNELGLSLFQAKKIMKYVKGWRPEPDQFKPSEASRRNSLNPRDWSEDDVVLHMTTLKLTDFGHFCRMNQVNGDLLLDILDKETLASVSRDHHVKISNIESKKLLNFVVKGWRPDVSPKISAGL